MLGDMKARTCRRSRLPLALAVYANLTCASCDKGTTGEAKSEGAKSDTKVHSAASTPHATVCIHLVELMDTTKMSDELRADLPAQCEAELAATHARIGDEAYETHAACLLGLTSITTVSSCDPPPPAATDLDMRMCEHLAQLMKKHLQGEGIEVRLPMVETARNDCLPEAVETRLKLGDEAYGELVDCYLAANSRSETLKCD
jgi:predicted solute-binding protein